MEENAMAKIRPRIRLGAASALALMLTAAPAAAWEPTKPVEIVVAAGAGGANKVLIAYSLIYMLPLSAKIPFNWRELTPVSVVALDQFVLWDNTTGPKSVKDFVAAAKAAS